MRFYTVDASVVAKWFFPEDLTPLAESLLEQALAGDARLVAPDLLLCEMGSIVLRKLTAAQVGQDDAEAVLLSLPSLPIRLVSAAAIPPAALRLAVLSGASYYDAVYLALAQQSRSTLVTADEALARQARRGGMSGLVTDLADLATSSP